MEAVHPLPNWIFFPCAFYLLFTVNSGNVQPFIPVPSGHLPGQPQALSNQIVQPANSDHVGMEPVMQFVANTFAGAMLMDSHSVC